MKKYTFLFSVSLLTLFALTACMDKYDEPPYQDEDITCKTSVGEVNTTIKDIKIKYSNVVSTNNTYARVDSNLVFEGYVVCNDVSGNLYQTLVVRDIREDGSDQCIQVGIKNTHLSPYFPLGSKIRMNAKDLYVGNYSYVPKIGQPYYTSAGNLRLGPMLLQYCQTQVQVVKRYATTHEDSVAMNKHLTPIEATQTWLSSHKTVENVPCLATVEGSFPDADGTKIFAPYEEHDDGYGVNRNFKVGNKTIIVRTSTRNEISYTVIPQGKVRVTGMLTYYGSDWQLSMRDLNDLKVINQ